MKKTVVNSFINAFVASVKGDDATVQAEKAWRTAEAALKVQIAANEGDIVSLEDNVATATEDLEAAKINNGNPIVNRDSYISDLISLNNALDDQKEALEAKKALISFLQGIYKDLKTTQAVTE